MKIGVIFFHKNIRSIYKERWINKCIDTILNQTVNDFTIYEINYGGDDLSLFKDLEIKNQHVFIAEEKSNHAEAMNRIIDLAFSDGCDFVFNTNLDDFYHLQRIEKQLEKLRNGYDLVSSDFCYIKENGDEDVISFFKNIRNYGEIRDNLDKNHNVIAHPCVAYSKKFWNSSRYIPEEIPEEDLKLWKRSIGNGFGLNFYIYEDILLYYRLHENQITGDNSNMATRAKS
jgi:hypothetical protein